ncbi:putative YCII-related protein [Parafrankia sp. Ea1.12]|uniref:YciI family protein n=1 Tax=Parafrankia sp. Ea1.12 TaxID=573499 RepID=UPI000DA4D2DD|nr:YciI family protein [Parafrankia sp. Ea1.12]SQD93586.1 putative YCII-related protein [Parafrankia sp. Ea1.12]
MKFASYTLVTMVRQYGSRPLPPEEEMRVRDAHLANMADMHSRGLLLAAGPSRGADENVRGFAIMLCDVATSEELWAKNPSVLAGRFEARCAPWVVPAEMIVAGPGLPPRSVAETTA